MNKPPAEPPNCNHCVHFYITYDASFRYGCRAFDFKSARLPMLDVFDASGQECQHYTKKERKLK
ncbi:MAG: hypothetical protein V4634_21790 [Pseudomonadota bacterium]